MTREQAKELLPIIKAFAEGEIIQYKNFLDEWTDIEENEGLSFICPPSDYRIKSQPKYRPFKSQEECLKEMHKHPDFGFIRERCTRAIYSISMIDNFYLSTQDKSEPLSDTLEGYEFLDGAPFGIKEDRYEQ